MQDTQSFEDAADAVQQSNRSKSQEVAEVVYERREYPKCPEGTYVAICVSTQLKQVPDDAKFDAGMQKIHHRWEILRDARTGQDVTYTDPTDPEKKPRRYQVFGKPLSISFGDRANLSKLMVELTGIPPLQDVTEEMRTFQGVATPKKVRVIKFNQQLLEYMECELKVKHKPYQDSMGATQVGVSIDSYDCPPAMRYKNWLTLPPHPQKVAFVNFEQAKAAYENRNGSVSAQQPQQPQHPMVDTAQQAGQVFGGNTPQQAQPAVGRPPIQQNQFIEEPKMSF